MRSDSDYLYEAASTAVLLASGSLISMVVAGLGSVLLARILGPEGYGAYSLVLTVPAFLMVFVDLGMSAAMVRYLPMRPERAPSYVSLGVLVTIATGSLAILLGALACGTLSRVIINRPEYSDLVLLSMPYLLAQPILNIARASLVGMGRSAKAAALEPLYNVLRVSLSVALAAVMFVRGSVLGVVIASVASSTVGLTLLARSLGGIRLELRPRDLREVLRFSAPLYAAGLVGSLTQVYTVLVLSRFFADFEIGNYRAALNLLSAISVITVAPLSTALLRVFSEADARDLRSLLADSVRYVAIFSVPLALFSSAASHDMVRVVYGRRYAEAEAYFSIVVLANALTLLGSHALEPALSAMGMTKLVLLTGVVGSLVYVPALYALVGALGLYGAALSYLLLLAVTTLARLHVLRRYLGSPLDAKFSVKVLASAALPSLAVLAMGRGQGFADSLLLLVTKFAVFLAAYVALLAASRAVSARDIERLSVLSRSLGPLSALVGAVLRYASLLVKLLQG